MEAGYAPLPYSYVSFEGFLNAKLLVEVLKRMGPGPTKAALKESSKASKVPIWELISRSHSDHTSIKGWTRFITPL